VLSRNDMVFIVAALGATAAHSAGLDGAEIFWCLVMLFCWREAGKRERAK